MKLVINADDLGYSPERNRGIFECFKTECSITSTSVLANGIASESGLKEACELGLPIGLHFNITEGIPLSHSQHIPSLLNSRGNFLGKFGIHKAAEKGEMKYSEICYELECQIKWFHNITGKYPTHVDGHNHAHVLPIVRLAFADTLKKFHIKYTRVPIDHTVTNPTSDFISYVINNAKIAATIFEENSIEYTNFFGLETMGAKMSIEIIKTCLNKFSNDSSVECELMTHPGYPCVGEGGCGTGPDEFSQSEDRQHELQILTSKKMKQLFEDYDVSKTSFEELVL